MRSPLRLYLDKDKIIYVVYEDKTLRFGKLQDSYKELVNKNFDLFKYLNLYYERIYKSHPDRIKGIFDYYSNIHTNLTGSETDYLSFEENLYNLLNEHHLNSSEVDVFTKEQYIEFITLFDISKLDFNISTLDHLKILELTTMYKSILAISSLYYETEEENVDSILDYEDILDSIIFQVFSNNIDEDLGYISDIILNKLLEKNIDIENDYDVIFDVESEIKVIINQRILPYLDVDNIDKDNIYINICLHFINEYIESNIKTFRKKPKFSVVK